MMRRGTNFTTLQKASRRRQKEWDPKGKLTPLFFATELAGECGEACNIIKKIERQRLGLKGSQATTHQLGKELSDIIQCAINIANVYEIKSVKAIVKAKFNEVSDRHGFNVKLLNTRRTGKKAVKTR